MLLRLILVGLVTSMGFTLPSSRDVSSFTESGRSWAIDNVCYLTSPSVPMIPVTPALAPSTSTVEATPVAAAPEVAEVAVAAVETDDDFQATVGAMATDFAADEAALNARLAAAETDRDASIIAPESPSGAALSEGEEVATMTPAEPAAEPVSVVVVEQPTVVVVVVAEEEMGLDDEAPTRLDRLAAAVRLTREAAQAWADVIADAPAVETDCTR